MCTLVEQDVSKAALLAQCVSLNESFVLLSHVHPVRLLLTSPTFCTASSSVNAFCLKAILSARLEHDV